jgi:ribosomal protein S18 acetylase RimI-like enzyme
MPDLTYHPPLADAPAAFPFEQTVRLLENRQQLGSATWYASGQGVVQLLDFSIAASHRRMGHGQRLLEASIKQMSQFYRARQLKLRRLWVNIEQKQQVIARAFLTGEGFHHVATLGQLFKDQDGLIYLKAFD